MNVKITFLPANVTVSVPAGTSLLAAQQTAGLRTDAPCGGHGTCGKCRVVVDGKTVLACQTTAERDMTVTLPGQNASHQILTYGSGRAITPEPLTQEKYTAGVDIGTTTVVLYLMDNRTGATLATASELNPQTRYGADVISRIQYAMDGGLDELSSCIRECLAALLRRACKLAGVATTEVGSLTAVGNTAMHHLLLGLSPATLAVAPYQPLVKDAQCRPAAELGLPLAENGVVYTLPCIAGFVGADTVAVALSQELDTIEDWTLLLDLGTNGELILGNRHRSIACSTAAGPAFEGAKIRCGTRCVPGALDHAGWDGAALTLHTYEDCPITGICGSGLLDLVAALRQAGVIEETGRMLTAEEAAEEVPTLADRIARVDGELCFLLGAGENPVRLTQQDVREVQLAKAAIAAGIELLAKHLGIAVDDIRKVHIAGAFGSYLNPESALEIGLLPKVLAGRLDSIGNAAGEGARCAAVNGSEFRRASTITEGIAFLELASDPEFQDCFVDHLSFEEEDE